MTAQGEGSRLQRSGMPPPTHPGPRNVCVRSPRRVRGPGRRRGREQSSTCLSRPQASGCLSSPQPVAPPLQPVDLLEKELMRKKMFKVLRKWAASQGPGNSQTHEMSMQTLRCLPCKVRRSGPDSVTYTFPPRLHPSEQCSGQAAPLPHVHGPASPWRGSDLRLPHCSTITPPAPASMWGAGPSEGQAGRGLASSLWLRHLPPSKPPSRLAHLPQSPAP